MKKIIVELLEQYEKDMDMPQFAVQYYTDEYIISKHYGFIKRLVDNDKIDHKIYEDMKFTAIKQGALIDKKSGSTAQETREIIKNGCIDTFIALLAISDTPIQDLCVWLK